MKAEVIAIGSELTCGARLDTNSQWLSQELESIGWTVHRQTTLSDDRDDLVAEFRSAANRSSVVLVTGGLGPTLDDITRECLADAFHESLVSDDRALQHIQKLFLARGRSMPERNKVQACRPQSAEMIPNAHGTAPGILYRLKDPQCLVIAMPGVPAEMKLMFEEHVRPALPKSGIFVQRTVIRSFGIGESEAERRLGDLTARGRNPEVGITASGAVISLSITARAGSSDQCDVMSRTVREQIEECLAETVFGFGADQLHDVVIRMLGKLKLRIGLLEGTTTGGLINQWLTEDEPGQTLVTYGLLYSSDVPPSGDDGPDKKDWRGFCSVRARQLIDSDTVDFVLASSPTNRQVDDQNVRSQVGSVLLIGKSIEQEQDVSMAGNLAIFRARAARTALNLLRLHLRSSVLADADSDLATELPS